MSGWIVDNASTLYGLFALTSIGLLAAWWLARRTPRRGGQIPSSRPYLVGLAGVAVLCGLVWTVDHFTVTDTKQIEQAMDAMAAGARSGNVDQIFEHISDSFRVGSKDKASFRAIVEGFLRSGEVTDVQIWAVDVNQLSRETRSAIVICKAKLHGNRIENPAGENLRIDFVLDADGKWRMRTFHWFLPEVDPIKGDPMPLPF